MSLADIRLRPKVYLVIAAQTADLCGYFLLWAAKTIRKTVRTIIIISKSDIIASPPFLLWIRGSILSAGAKRPTTAYRFTGQAHIYLNTY